MVPRKVKKTKKTRLRRQNVDSQPRRRRLTADEINLQKLAPLFASTGKPPPPRDKIKCPICSLSGDKFVFGTYYNLVRHFRRSNAPDHRKWVPLLGNINMREQYVDLEEEETTTTLFSDIVQDNPPPPDYHIFKNFLPPDSPDNGEEEEVEEEDEEMGDDEEDTVKVDVDADIDSDLAKMCRYCLESFGDKKILWKHVARHKKRGHESLFDDGKEKKVESDEMKTMLIDDDKEKVETVTTLFDDDDKVKVKTETMKTISSDEEEEYDEILLRKGIRFAQQVGNDVLPDAVYSPEAVPIQLEVVISPVEGLSFYNETEEMVRK